MPIYEYACGSCGARFEVLVRSGRDGRPACPDCGAGRCRKAFSTFATGGGIEEVVRRRGVVGVELHRLLEVELPRLPVGPSGAERAKATADKRR